MNEETENQTVLFSSLDRQECTELRARLTAMVEQKEASLQTMLGGYLAHDSTIAISEAIEGVKAGGTVDLDLVVLSLTVLNRQMEIAKRKAWLAGVNDRLQGFENGG